MRGVTGWYLPNAKFRSCDKTGTIPRINSLPIIMKFFFALLLTLTARAAILAVPHPSCVFDDKQTVIWTPLFQAAWDALDEAHQGGDKPSINPPNKVMEMLDGFAWKADEVLPKGAWFVQAGPMNRELYDKANQEAQQRWGIQPFTFTPTGQEQGYAALAMLSQQVQYVTPFERAIHTALPFQAGNTKQGVRFFGSPNAENLTAVRVIHYNGKERTFALEVRCKGADERVIFYMPAKSSTFAESCQQVLKWKRSEVYEQEDGSLLQDRLQTNEEIRIPYVSLHNAADFTPLLQGERTYPKLDTPVLIRKAQQTVFFQLDEKGADARAIVDIGGDPFATVDMSNVRVFHFDRPFYVFLWREKAEWPYLGVWLGDTSAMRLFEE